MKTKAIASMTVLMFLGSMLIVAFPKSVQATMILFVPSPTGVPETDWANIQNALDQAMPGDTVQLAEGHYKVHRPLVKDGFNGNLKGAGKDVTIVEAVKASDGSMFVTIYLDAWDDYNFPGSRFYATPLFYLPRATGNVVISEMTVEVNSLDLAPPAYVTDSDGNVVFVMEEWEGLLFIFFDLFPVGDCNTAYKNVRMKGTLLPGGDSRPWPWASPTHGSRAIGLLGADGGRHTVENCDFENIGTIAYDPEELSNAEIIVGGSPQTANTFTNCGWSIAPWFNTNSDLQVSYNTFTNSISAPIYMIENSFSIAEVSHNTMIDCVGGVAVWQEEASGVSTFIFEHNEIQIKEYSGWAGFEIWNLHPEKKADVIISSNSIHSEHSWETAPWGPIFTFGVHDALIANNQITGSGPAAMYLGVYGEPSSGLTLLGNNVQNWDAEVAPIWLGPGTSDCTVAGGNLKHNVFDEGTNNILTGVNNMQGNPPSQNIKDAMELKKEIMRSYP